MCFTLRTQVLPSDIDELGHTSNVVYVRWVVQAAVAHADSVGLTAEEYRARKQMFVVRRHEIEYFRAAVCGDPISINTRVTAFRAATSERQAIIRRTADDAVLACARTRFAFVERESGAPLRIPEDLRALLPAEPSHAEWLKHWRPS